MAGNVISWGKAVLQGLEPGLYSHEPDKVPVGRYEAVLDFKIWSRKTMGIGCFFTIKTTKEKIQLTVYCNRRSGLYQIQNGDLDFADCPIGCLYAIEIGLNVINQRRKMFMKMAALTEIATIKR